MGPGLECLLGAGEELQRMLPETLGDWVGLGHLAAERLFWELRACCFFLPGRTLCRQFRFAISNMLSRKLRGRVGTIPVKRTYVDGAGSLAGTNFRSASSQVSFLRGL